MVHLNWRKHTGLIVGSVVVAAALIYGFWPQPIVVETVAVTRGPLLVTVDEEGKTRVIDRYVVSAPVAGFARRIELDVGDSVEQNHTLVELEPLRSQVLDPRSRAEAQARVAAAESSLHAAEQNVQAAKADADYATSEVKRLRKLAKDGLISQGDLERAEALARSTRAAQRSADFAVEVARYERDAARTALRYSAAQHKDAAAERVAVSAPVTGNVLKIFHQCEGVVDAGQALLEVGDPSAIEVEVEVLSADAVRIKPGTPIEFERWGGPKPLAGVVRVVEPVGFTKVSALGVEEQRVLVIADITSPREQWQRLGDGYRVEAKFILWEGSDVLQVPANTLFRYNDAWAVFTVQGNQALRRTIQIGKRNGLIAQVLAGLTEGEQVITHPDNSIEDGHRVRPR